MTSLFVLPLPESNSRSIRGSTSKKRRRDSSGESKQGNRILDPVTARTNTNGSQRDLSQPVEYTAVVSPAERSQRRLAGHSLDEEPPSKPFPHAKVPNTKLEEDLDHVALCKAKSLQQHKSVSSSWHHQRLSTLTAILHRSLLRQDFSRASWALGLILREENDGLPIDIRSQGNWGVAAEILLRRDSRSGLRNAPDTDPLLDAGSQNSVTSTFTYTIQGWERVKKYYENLIVQYPYTRTWADSINSIDFYLAMFNVWIYIVQAEYSSHQDFSETNNDDSSSSPTSPRDSMVGSRELQQLAQANQIATRMDSCMGNIPYRDEPEFIRLRAMVSFWLADLYDSQTHDDTPDDVASNNSDNEDRISPRVDERAADERKRARALLIRLDKAQQNISTEE